MSIEKEIKTFLNIAILGKRIENITKRQEKIT